MTQVTRPDPSGATATTTIVYGLPLSGTGLPDVTGATAASWDETTDLPTTGTAVFPPTHVPAGTTPGAVSSSDWAYASISYLDVNGRDVNDAGYLDGGWQVGTSQYDQYGNTVWSLTPGNRAQALGPTENTDPYVAAVSGSADRADLLATVDTYSADGLELLDELGPMHPVTLADGSQVDARAHSVTTYDEGAPNGDLNPATGGAYMLPTTVVTSAQGVDGTEYQTLTSHTGYDPIDGASSTGETSGWTLGVPTTSTDPGGLQTLTRYNNIGQVVEQRLPGDANGTGPRTTLITYYTVGVTGSCVDVAQAGLVCASAPAAQPATGDLLPVTTYSYDRYDNPVTKTETYGSGSAQVVRTTSTGYDPAERVDSSSVAVSPASAGGTSLPTVSYGYDTGTGLPVTSSTTTGGTTTTLTTGYDDLGQATSYTDATGSTSTASYDLDGRLASLDDGKGTTSYSYDPHSGLLTSEDVGVTGAPSTFTAGYDAAGNLASVTYPNGLVAARAYDNAGELTDLAYTMNGTGWLEFQQDFNGAGQVADQSSPISSQTFSYDGSDRLTQVQDTTADPATGSTVCTTRRYTFNTDSDRTLLQSYPAAADGTCSTATTATATGYTYDQADRLTSDTAGAYSYDPLGRASGMPAGDASGVGAHAGITGNVTVGYYANDMVATEAQGTGSMSFTLDPDQNRIASFTDAGVTTVNHYTGDGDSPAWSSTGTGWTRNLTGIDGALAGTVDQAGTVTLELADPHGDVVATAADDPNAAGTLSYSESTEYGAPRDPAGGYSSYGWLGGKQRSSNDLAGLLLMGVRLYNPDTGRFLSVDPVPGGNANPYTYPNDPINAYDLNGQCGLWGHNTCWSDLKGTVSRGIHWLGAELRKHWHAIVIGAIIIGSFMIGAEVVTFAIEASEVAAEASEAGASINRAQIFLRTVMRTARATGRLHRVLRYGGLIFSFGVSQELDSGRVRGE